MHSAKAKGKFFFLERSLCLADFFGYNFSRNEAVVGARLIVSLFALIIANTLQVNGLAPTQLVLFFVIWSMKRLSGRNGHSECMSPSTA